MATVNSESSLNVNSKVDLEGCKAAGSYIIDFGKRFPNQPLRQCGKDWLLWCLDQDWSINRPEFRDAATKYVKYLDAHPGKCVIVWRGRYLGRTIDECGDADYITWFSYAPGVFVQNLFPQCCQAGRLWLRNFRNTRTIQIIRSIQQAPVTVPEAVSVPATTEIVYPIYVQSPEDEDEPADHPHVRHYLANRDIGELARKRWDGYEIAAGTAEDYVYDDFLVEDDSEIEDGDSRSEISAFYGENGSDGAADGASNSTDAEKHLSEEEMDSAPARTTRSMRRMESDNEPEESATNSGGVSKTPTTSRRKGKRRALLTPSGSEYETDDSTPRQHMSTSPPRTRGRKAAEMVQPPVTPTQGIRRSQRLATKLATPRPSAALPTPQATPAKGIEVSGHSGNGVGRSSPAQSSPRKRRHNTDSSEDDNDDEPLSTRLQKKQFQEITPYEPVHLSNRERRPRADVEDDDEEDELPSVETLKKKLVDTLNSPISGGSSAKNTKTCAKKVVTPRKTITPAKQTATPAKKTATPAKKKNSFLKSVFDESSEEESLHDSDIEFIDNTVEEIPVKRTSRSRRKSLPNPFIRR